MTGIDESIDASRVSPYSIAAFAVSVVGLWLVPQSSFFFFGGQLGWETIFAAAVPAATAGVALWLTGRAEEEIYLADGRFGGAGFCRAARVVAFLTIGALLIGIVVPYLDSIPSFFDN